MFEAADPQGVPGWDELALSRSFYVAADWLRCADSDWAGRSRYLGLPAGERLLAALSSHWTPVEVGDGYDARLVLEVEAGVLAADEGVLTFGGRRGLLSGVLLEPGTSRDAAAGHLAELIRHATAAVPAQGVAWWWPYLVASDVDVVVAAARRLGGATGQSGGAAGPGVHLIGADCVIDLAGASVDDHVAALPLRQRRTNFRREDERFTGSGLEIRQVGLREYWPRLGQLLAAVQQKYGHRQQAGELGDRLRRQGEHLASRAVVFGCFSGDILVGFSLAYQWAGELALRAVGFDYEQLPGAEEYAQLAVHAPLRYCYASGLRRLHLGTESYEAKCRRGARPRPLWAVTSLPGPDPGSVSRTARRIAAALPSHESKTFITKVEQSWRRWAANGV
jgi:hypothetical protein